MIKIIFYTIKIKKIFYNFFVGLILFLFEIIFKSTLSIIFFFVIININIQSKQNLIILTRNQKKKKWRMLPKK